MRLNTILLLFRGLHGGLQRRQQTSLVSGGLDELLNRTWQVEQSSRSSMAPLADWRAVTGKFARQLSNFR
jgi:hypothetical protein